MTGETLRMTLIPLFFPPLENLNLRVSRLFGSVSTLTRRRTARWPPPPPPGCRTPPSHTAPSQSLPGRPTPPPARHTHMRPGPDLNPANWRRLVVVNRPAHPDDGEGVLLLVVQVLLDVKEGVEEDVGQLAPLQVSQGDPPCRGGGAHSTKC